MLITDIQKRLFVFGTAGLMRFAEEIMGITEERYLEIMDRLIKRTNEMKNKEDWEEFWKMIDEEFEGKERYIVFMQLGLIVGLY